MFGAKSPQADRVSSALQSQLVVRGSIVQLVTGSQHSSFPCTESLWRSPSSLHGAWRRVFHLSAKFCMASSPWYKTQRVAAMAPLQLYLAVFRDFRRGGKKIHTQPMGDGKHRNGNWQRISSSWNEELCWRNPRPEYSSVGVCYVSSCGLLLTRESWTISLKSESTPKATATSK